jgi:hypothetical protein
MKGWRPPLDKLETGSGAPEEDVFYAGRRIDRPVFIPGSSVPGL